MEAVFEVLRSRADKDDFTAADASDLDRWAKERNLTTSAFLNRLGAEIARNYNSGELSFNFCDSILNDLEVIVIERLCGGEDMDWPDLFDKVYLAFDAGEFHRQPDKSDDPIADFTNPLIAEIVRRLEACS